MSENTDSRVGSSAFVGRLFSGLSGKYNSTPPKPEEPKPVLEPSKLFVEGGETPKDEEPKTQEVVQQTTVLHGVVTEEERLALLAKDVPLNETNAEPVIMKSNTEIVEEQKPAVEQHKEQTVTEVTDEPPTEPEVVEQPVQDLAPPVTTVAEEPLVEPTEEKVVVEESKDEEQSIGDTKPSYNDSAAFNRLSQSSTVDNSEATGSYAEMIESMVSAQCQKNGVKNLDLTSFGVRAQVLKYNNLSIIEYGTHKFLGAPFTEEEENMIIHRIGVHVAQSPEKRIVIRAVKEVKDTYGMPLYSLMFSESIARKYAEMFGQQVYINLHEADVSKLVLVIQK